MKEKLIALLLENINLEGMSNALIDGVLEPALKKVVADSANTLDDMAMAAIYPVLEKELKEYIAKLISELND